MERVNAIRYLAQSLLGMAGPLEESPWELDRDRLLPIASLRD